MPLKFLLDENLRGPLWNAFQRQNVAAEEPLDIPCVGDPAAPPLGTKDPELLVWLEENDRILVTRDKSSMPGHLRDHLEAGRHCPGILTVGRLAHVPAAVELVALAAVALDAVELRDQINYLDA